MKDSAPARIAAQNFMDLLNNYQEERFGEPLKWDTMATIESSIILKADVAVKKISESVKAIVDRLDKKDRAALKETGKIEEAKDLLNELQAEIFELFNLINLSQSKESDDDRLNIVGKLKKWETKVLKYLNVASLDVPSDHSDVIESQLKDLYDQLEHDISEIPMFK